MLFLLDCIFWALTCVNREQTQINATRQTLSAKTTQAVNRVQSIIISVEKFIDLPASFLLATSFILFAHEAEPFVHISNIFIWFHFKTKFSSVKSEFFNFPQLIQFKLHRHQILFICIKIRIKINLSIFWLPSKVCIVNFQKKKSNQT